MPHRNVQSTRLGTLIVGALVVVLWLQSGCTQPQPTASTPAEPAQKAVPTDQRERSQTCSDLSSSVEAYYGVQTARALENFQISGTLINQYPGFVEAWAIVKLAGGTCQHGGWRDEEGDALT